MPLTSEMPPPGVRPLRLGKEIGEFLANDFHLPEHQVTSRFEADKPSTADALSRALTRFVRRELVVLGMDDQGRHANGLQVVVVDIRVGDIKVEVETIGTHGEQTVDELVDESGVLTTHGEPFGDRRHEAGHR